MIFGRYTVREAFFERFMINQQKLVAYATDTATNTVYDSGSSHPVRV